MPMNVGIHRKPIGRGYLAFLDSRIRGNDGGMFFLRKHLTPESLRVPQQNKKPFFGKQVRQSRTCFPKNISWVRRHSMPTRSWKAEFLGSSYKIASRVKIQKRQCRVWMGAV